MSNSTILEKDGCRLPPTSSPSPLLFKLELSTFHTPSGVEEEGGVVNCLEVERDKGPWLFLLDLIRGVGEPDLCGVSISRSK